MGSYSHALTQWQPQAQRGIADVIQRIQGRDRLQDLGSARPGHYDIHTHTEQPKRYKHGKILLSKIISHKLKFYLFLGLLYNYTMFVGSTQILVSWWLNIRCLQVGSPFCLVESPAFCRFNPPCLKAYVTSPKQGFPHDVPSYSALYSHGLLVYFSFSQTYSISI